MKIYVIVDAYVNYGGLGDFEGEYASGAYASLKGAFATREEAQTFIDKYKDKKYRFKNKNYCDEDTKIIETELYKFSSNKKLYKFNLNNKEKNNELDN